MKLRHRDSLRLSCPFGLRVLLFVTLSALCSGQSSPKRARDLGIPFDGQPGAFNAITDVEGVLVGQRTLISGHGSRAVRTGVTVVLANSEIRSVPAAVYCQNGDGEMTGAHFIEEKGYLISPVAITNTLGVGTACNGIAKWSLETDGLDHAVLLPVVAETWDGWLNDIEGFALQESDVIHALQTAHTGNVAEGNVGGGTGMICHGYKGGIGTASRVLSEEDGGYTVGVLVQANHGERRELRIAGIPIGRELAEGGGKPDRDDGSIIVILATDAPLLPTQLRRMARRIPLGLARCGSFSGTESGDIFLAFTTCEPDEAEDGTLELSSVPDAWMDPLFLAAVRATEEAIVNALVAAKTMKGYRGRTIEALPHDGIREALRRHGLLRANTKKR